jgi:hypothetical protein
LEKRWFTIINEGQVFIKNENRKSKNGTKVERVTFDVKMKESEEKHYSA